VLNKIVIAEDDDAIAHMVNMALGDAGFLCMRARDGDEAINLVRHHAPDLMVLDVMMPRTDGLEVVRRLRADVQTSRTPVLMLTALGGVDEKVKGLDAGADDYMTKPFDLRELAARVRALIRAYQREAERNPTTNLPGSGAIEQHISGLLGEGADTGVVHFDVIQFDEFADRVGYNKAEELARSIAQLMVSQARMYDSGVFVGHLGGCDFIACGALGDVEELAGDVTDMFPQRAKAWTGEESLHLAAGLVQSKGLTAEELATRLGRRLHKAKVAAVSGVVSSDD